MVKTEAKDGFACQFGWVMKISAVEKRCTNKVLGLILTTSIFALPLALAAFPQRQAVLAKSLEEEFWEKGGRDGKVEFNRGI